MTSVKITPLDNVIVFSLGAISLWSGRGRLQPEDFGAASIDLPPAAVASLGSKRLISGDILVKLDKVKRKMHRLLASSGTKFLNGYAVAVDRAEGLAKALDVLVAEGNALRQNLLDNFDSLLADWHRENPEWAHILRAGTPEKEAVHKRINFGWDAFMVRTPANEKVARSMLGAAASLGSTLYGEISAEAKDFVSKSLKPGREKGSQRTATPVRRMVEKLRGLQFLDHRIGPLTKVFDKIVENIPATGVIEGHAYLCMLRCAYVLADVDEMQRLGERAGDGEPIDDLAAEIIGALPAAAAPAAQSAQSEKNGVAVPHQVLPTTAAQQVDVVMSAEQLFDDAKVVPSGELQHAREIAPVPSAPLANGQPVLRVSSLKPSARAVPGQAKVGAAAPAHADAASMHMVAIDF